MSSSWAEDDDGEDMFSPEAIRIFKEKWYADHVKWGFDIEPEPSSVKNFTQAVKNTVPVSSLKPPLKPTHTKSNHTSQWRKK